MRILLLALLIPATSALFWNSWPFCCCGGCGYYGGGYGGYGGYNYQAAAPSVSNYPASYSPISTDGSLPAGSQIIWYEKPIPVQVDTTQLQPINIAGPPPGYKRTITQTIYRNYPVARPTHIAHPIESDVVNGYEPAYSAWNPQPIQAVFKNGPSRYGSGGYTNKVRSPPHSEQTSGDRIAPPPENPPEEPQSKTAETPTEKEINEFLAATKEMDKMQQTQKSASAPSKKVASPFDDIKERKTEPSEIELPEEFLAKASRKSSQGTDEAVEATTAAADLETATVVEATTPVNAVEPPHLKHVKKMRGYYIQD
ncbi:hypothetical protein QR680_003503 [Steinernema hermaphroditum]|uniref:Uncharacterized protein n=1 Tax=Steinernema hermaphroditum TaxID=289476 RepID=A0AA39HKM7_9BILA|nr:hypothetical protein QR680_003503 [Steinernema hermaphroditum]